MQKNMNFAFGNGRGRLTRRARWPEEEEPGMLRGERKGALTVLGLHCSD